MREPYAQIEVDAFEVLFEDLWAASGPGSRVDFSKKSAVYYRTLRDVPETSLRVGLDKIIAAHTDGPMPRAGAWREAALQHMAAVRQALDAKERSEGRAIGPWNRCACGCGGRLWYSVMRDGTTGQVRTHAVDVAEQTTAPAVLERMPSYAKALRALAGQPMLKPHMECRGKGEGDRYIADRLPTIQGEVRFLGYEPPGTTDRDGAPVYDLGVPAAAKRASAQHNQGAA
jgi:hypothetical protein